MALLFHYFLFYPVDFIQLRDFFFPNQTAKKGYRVFTEEA